MYKKERAKNRKVIIHKLKERNDLQISRKLRITKKCNFYEFCK